MLAGFSYVFGDKNRVWQTFEVNAIVAFGVADARDTVFAKTGIMLENEPELIGFTDLERSLPSL